MATPERARDARFDYQGRLRPVYVERVGREAVAAAIAEHKGAGRAIYYADPEHPGFLIEEHANGRRFLVERGEQGKPKVVRELPSA